MQISIQNFMPPKVFSFIFHRLEFRTKFVFVASVICGFLTHLVMLVNKFPNHDDVAALIFNSNILSSGRWFLKYPALLSSIYSLPLVCGTIAIVMLALIVCLIVHILDVQNMLCLLLVAAGIATFPSVTGTFAFMFAVDAYFIAAFMATLGAYFTVRFRKGFLIGIMLFAAATGVYQAYFSLAVAILFLHTFFSFLDERTTIQTVLKKGLKYLVTLILGLTTYLVILKFLLVFRGTALSNYSNIDQMGVLTVKRVIYAIQETYRQFSLYFFTGYNGVFPIWIIAAHLVMFLSAIIFLVYITINMQPRDYKRILLLALCMAFFPMGLQSIVLVTPVGTKISILMLFSNCLIYGAFAKLLDLFFHIFETKASFVGKQSVCSILFVGTSWTALICIAAIFWNGYLLANKAYFKMFLAYENSYYLAAQITSRVEGLAEYTVDMPVMITGLTFPNKNYLTGEMPFRELDGLQGVFDDYIFSVDSAEYDQGLFRAFVSYYLGRTLIAPSGDLQKKVCQSEEWEQMTHYPAQDSIQIIEGVVVIKMNES